MLHWSCALGLSLKCNVSQPSRSEHHVEAKTTRSWVHRVRTIFYSSWWWWDICDHIHSWRWLSSFSDWQTNSFARHIASLSVKCLPDCLSFPSIAELLLSCFEPFGRPMRLTSFGCSNISNFFFFIIDRVSVRGCFSITWLFVFISNCGWKFIVTREHRFHNIVFSSIAIRVNVSSSVLLIWQFSARYFCPTWHGGLVPKSTVAGWRTLIKGFELL